ncbi:conserved hypothetical protein [Trichinella spiralis]|uniref:hypothetical protein n=1 Tax=Trichinella spiralis TaxID=6334 RepID=UPI0001EFE92F|nr:conserved hypothetical protein [Trichinella spiralis]
MADKPKAAGNAPIVHLKTIYCEQYKSRGSQQNDDALGQENRLLPSKCCPKCSIQGSHQSSAKKKKKKFVFVLRPRCTQQKLLKMTTLRKIIADSQPNVQEKTDARRSSSSEI